MNRDQISNWALALIATLALGLVVSGWLDDWAEARSRRVFEAEARRAVLEKVSDLPDARLVSIRVDREGEMACGWMHLTSEVGSVPFMVMSIGDGDRLLSLAPRLDLSDPAARADHAFTKHMVLSICGEERRWGGLPDPPPDAHWEPAVDQPLRALWDEPGQDWAVIPVGDAGYIALRRKVGGGATRSPVFADRREAVSWTRGEGALLARKDDRRGAERLRQLDACLERHAADDPAALSC